MKKKINIIPNGGFTPKETPKRGWFGDKGMKKLAKTIKKNKDQKALDKAKQIKQIKYISISVVFILLVIFFVSLINRYVRWARNNTIIVQSPITIQKQKMIEVVSLAELNRRIEVTKMRSELSEIVEGIILKPTENKLNEIKIEVNKLSINSDEFFDFIWNAESSKGKNKPKGSLAQYCESIGMWNEIGFDPSHKFCFKDEKEARWYIPFYIYKNGKGLTMSELLCYYNQGNNKETGKPNKTCAYSESRFAEAN